MQVLLKEDIDNLGYAGEVKKKWPAGMAVTTCYRVGWRSWRRRKR